MSKYAGLVIAEYLIKMDNMCIEQTGYTMDGTDIRDTIDNDVEFRELYKTLVGTNVGNGSYGMGDVIKLLANALIEEASK